MQNTIATPEPISPSATKKEATEKQRLADEKSEQSSEATPKVRKENVGRSSARARKRYNKLR